MYQKDRHSSANKTVKHSNKTVNFSYYGNIMLFSEYFFSNFFLGACPSKSIDAESTL